MNTLQILHFYADWCGPCKLYEPILKQIQRDIDIEMLHVNIELNPEFADEFGILSIPTLVFLKDNKEVKRSVGLLSYNELLSVIKEVR